MMLHEEGFEPSHLTIVDLKSTALDHSAIRASIVYKLYTYYILILSLSSFTYNIINRFKEKQGKFL